MKDIIKNRKGFTLVELLAVIVVLAIIILIALPAVLSSMEKARKNSFAVEVNEFIKAAQTAYSGAVMYGSMGTNYHEACITVDDLITYGYIDKKNGNEDYSGSILISVDNNGKSTYKVWVSNKAFMTTNAKSNDGIEGPIDSNNVAQDTTSTTAADETCGGKTPITISN